MEDAEVQRVADRLLYLRPDGRMASRAHLLVLPSVVCANAVSRKVAQRVPDAVAVTHQHGCAQIGDDAQSTSIALADVARHPNAWSTLVVSLGCETLQGGALAEGLRAEAVTCELVGIQQQGGSSNAVDEGVKALVELDTRPRHRVAAPGPVDIAIAYFASTEALAERYAQILNQAGFSVLAHIDLSQEPVLRIVEAAFRDRLLGIVLVADRGIPAGPVLTPLLSIAASEELFVAADGEYDLMLPSDEELIAHCAAMVSGVRTKAEQRGDAHFLIRRSLLTL